MNYVIIGIIGLAVGVAIGWMFRAKRKGKGCTGCPYSGSCGGYCGGKNSGENSNNK